MESKPGPRTDGGLGDHIAAAVDDRSARGIAAAIGRMISSGELPIGLRLPTVRELARSLGLSPTTVSEAWRTLAGFGAIEARGRQGTFVASHRLASGPARYRRVSAGSAHFTLDLSTGTPDPALLPDLGPVVARVGRQNLTSSYLDDPVLPPLAEVLRGLWPFEPEALTVVDGAMDALDRICREVIRIGDRVVVEHPTFPPLLDLLEQVGAEVIGVPLDDEGMTVDAMARALDTRPSVIVLQPRAHNPAGIAMSARRARALAGLLSGSDVLVVEDDHSGDIADAPLVSLGARRPGRTVHVRSFSKSHGPDLRLAAVGGAADVVSAVVERRLVGPGWSSRILQAVLLEMLTDDATRAAVGAARTEYRRRRQVITASLADNGVTARGRDGINLWLPVDDERTALVKLAARGIGAAPGEPFLVLPDSDHVRVTVGLVPGDDAELRRIGEVLAAAATSPDRARRH